MYKDFGDAVRISSNGQNLITKKAPTQIEIDGELDENDWKRAYFKVNIIQITIFGGKLIKSIDLFEKSEWEEGFIDVLTK